MEDPFITLEDIFIERFPKLNDIPIEDYYDVADAIDEQLHKEAMSSGYDDKLITAYKIFELLEFYQYNLISSMVFNYLIKSYSEQ